MVGMGFFFWLGFIISVYLYISLANNLSSNDACIYLRQNDIQLYVHVFFKLNVERYILHGPILDLCSSHF